MASAMNFEEPEDKEHKKQDSKMLTGKYDMSVLREIARVEEAALEELVELYGVEDEDDLPISFDIHELITLKEGERRATLEKSLEGCPGETQDFVEKYLDRIKDLNPRLT